MLAVDMSNYTSTLTPENLQALKDAGVGLVIPQAIDPPRGYPAGVTRQQIRACSEAGLFIDVYFYLWSNSDVHWDITDKLLLLEGYEDRIRQVWLDVEDVSAAPISKRLAAVRRGLTTLDEWCRAHDKPRTGIYTSIWYWPTYMNNTVEFGDRELWDADYDDVADAALGFLEYGGWDLSERRIKQFRGTSDLAGITGIDLNVLSVAEEGELNPEGDEEMKHAIPQEYLDNGWHTWFEVAVNLRGVTDTMGQQVEALRNELSNDQAELKDKLAKIHELSNV